VREVHVHGLGGVTQDLVELEGFSTHHSRFVLGTLIKRNQRYEGGRG
jgi:hypothetical protein